MSNSIKQFESDCKQIFQTPIDELLSEHAEDMVKADVQSCAWDEPAFRNVAKKVAKRFLELVPKRAAIAAAEGSEK